MSKLSYQKTLCGLAAVLFGITANGIAQEPGLTMAVQAPSCAGEAACPGEQASVPVPMGGPVIGEGSLGVVSTGGMAFALQENVEAVKNQPYQAQVVTEIKQTLADGMHITQRTMATVARDSDGRTVRIQKLDTMVPGKSPSDSSQANSPTLTSIFDPMAKTHTDYTSDSKVAHVLMMPTRLPGFASGAGGGRFGMMSEGPALAMAGADNRGTVIVGQDNADSSQVPSGSDLRTESLGTKTIEGIPVMGTKNSSTIPAGAMGNDKSIVITRETWYSPDLKLILLSSQTDPRFGETTYSLTNIKQSEPDPTLFQVPAGYEVEQVHAVVQPN